MTPETSIAELEKQCNAMTAELKKLKAELDDKRTRETVWQPKYYDAYMYIGSNGCVYRTILEDPAFERSKLHMYYNNVYHSNNKTQEHLKWYANNVLRVQNKLMQLHELLCPDYFPDCDEITSFKNYIVYKDTTKQKWTWCTYAQTAFSIVYFTEGAAEKACEILNREKFML